MKGGFNNPPNQELRPFAEDFLAASMKGGFNNPPNLVTNSAPYAKYVLQ